MVKITDHAIDRIRKRMGLSKSSVRRISKRAYKEGVQYKDLSGSIRRFINKQRLKSKYNTNIRIYGKFVFIFVKDVLVTVIHLPQKYYKTIEKIKEKLKNG